MTDLGGDVSITVTKPAGLVVTIYLLTLKFRLGSKSILDFLVPFLL